MRYPSRTFLNKLKFATIPSEELASYAYALNACKNPASVVTGDWYHKVTDVCEAKIRELRNEIISRLGNKRESAILTHALAVLDETESLVKEIDSQRCHVPLERLSVTELIKRHSLNKYQHEMRRCRGMEVFTRAYQWRIVNELAARSKSGNLARIMALAECIEADGYAVNLNLPYNLGEKPETFKPSDYMDDDALIGHIRSLSKKRDYISREELIQIADYIQTEIVEKGETANHMELVNAILRSEMPSFDYPMIVKGFENATKSLAKSDENKDIQLAPYYYSLWGLTSKASYLSRFERTVRRCYLTLADDKHYPGLGIDKEDSASLSSALQFLDEYRMWACVVNDKFDVYKIISNYTAV